jgi:uncharacterized protein YegL
MAIQARFALALAVTLSAVSFAQGRIVDRRPPRPPRPIQQQVKVESTQVQARIQDGVATTEVKMLLRNDSRGLGEKILLLPLPAGATADGLEMLVNGKPTKSEVLDAPKARGIYEEIVRRRRDPALLEYMGRDTLRLRVFPVPPRGTQQVTLRYRLLLRESGGLYAFEYPTRAVEAGAFSLDVKIATKQGLKNVYSPLQGWDIVRKDDHHARASFECKGRPQRDPVLYYGLDDRDFGLNLLTYRKQGKEGYFLLMLAPKRDWKNEQELRKSVTFVLDTSGSMQGAKIEQAKNALKFFLQSLKPADRFNIVPFSTEARPFAQTPVAASAEKIKEAMSFASGIDARGGTNIHEAMSFALQSYTQVQEESEHVPLVVFLTDGLPTVGSTDTQEILRDCRKANGKNARVFVFGVGHDVNTQLLDTMSRDFRGERDYVQPGENIEVKVGALFEKIAYPVLTDCRLECDKIQWSRLAPKELPDMFRGSRIVVAGRYSGSGHVAIRLHGKVKGEKTSYVFEGQFPELALENDFVASLWAQRRVGVLLEAIRLNGKNPELVQEITKLGKEHGIVTPFTSHLIVEETEQVARRFRRGRGLTPPTGGPSSPAPGQLREELKRVGFSGPVPDAEGQGGGLEPAENSAEDARRKMERLGDKKSGADAVKDSLDTGRPRLPQGPRRPPRPRLDDPAHRRPRPPLRRRHLGRRHVPREPRSQAPKDRSLLHRVLRPPQRAPRAPQAPRLLHVHRPRPRRHRDPDRAPQGLSPSNPSMRVRPSLMDSTSRIWV